MNFIWNKTTNVTVANTVTETSLLDTGTGSKVLLAGSLYDGGVIRVRVAGTFGKTVPLSVPTLRIRVKLGSTLVVDTGATQTHDADEEGGFEFDTDITCLGVVNGTATLHGQGRGYCGHAGLSGEKTTTLNAGSNHTLDVTCEWGAASTSNTLTASSASAWAPFAGETVDIRDFGAVMDDSDDDAPSIMAAIRYAQKRGARVIIPGTAYIRSPIVFSKPEGGQHRFELCGVSTARSVIQVSAQTEGNIEAMLKFDGADDGIDDLVFRDFRLNADGRADYGILCEGDHPKSASDLIFDHLRCEATRLAAFVTASWSVSYKHCQVYYGQGDGIILKGGINNNLTLENCTLLYNRGFGVKAEGGHMLAIRDSVIEVNRKGGIFVAGSCRALAVTGNYFEANATIGHDMETEDGSRTVRADVIVNGANPSQIERAWPSYEFTAIGNTHTPAPVTEHEGFFTEFAYYLPAVGGGRIENNVNSVYRGHILKLVGLYGEDAISRPQELVIGTNTGFARIARVELITSSAGSFVEGEYIAVMDGSEMTAIAKILSNVSGVLHVMGPERLDSADMFRVGDEVVPATLELMYPEPQEKPNYEFVAGSPTATIRTVSYRSRNVWIDGGVREGRRQCLSTFREEGVERRNFWNKALTEAPFEDDPVNIPFSLSYISLDILEVGNLGALTNGGRLLLTRNDASDTYGVKHNAHYYGRNVDGELMLFTSESGAIGGTDDKVDIGGDIGPGNALLGNGAVHREGAFMGLPVYRLSGKVRGESYSGGPRLTLDLDGEHERLAGRLVYLGCWALLSEGQVGLVLEANGLRSRTAGQYDDFPGWRWHEWQAELPYSGTVDFVFRYIANDAGTFAGGFGVHIANPILSLVGAPYTDYGTEHLVGNAVADPAGGGVIDVECRARLSELLAQLRAAGLVDP